MGLYNRIKKAAGKLGANDRYRLVEERHIKMCSQHPRSLIWVCTVRMEYFKSLALQRANGEGRYAKQIC